MISQHCHWRTAKEWQKLKVPIYTPSNEASKMFDATLTQMCAHYDDPSVGGMSGSMKAMLEADPDFLQGLCMSASLQMFGCSSTPDTDPNLKNTLNRLGKLATTRKDLCSAEKKHIKAVQLQSEGYLKEASVLWEDILVEHPHDLLALKLAYLTYIYVGDSPQLRDSPARVLPRWDPSTPLYGYLVGMHAFGLEENNLYERAEKQATKALELNPYDGWSTHSLSHVFEMTGQQQRGIKFLDSTVKDWEACGTLACHNWWHLALHHVEQGNFEQAMEIYETQVKSRCVKTGEMFNISDAASLLFRLQMEGVTSGDKWKEIQEVCQPYLGKHTSVFYDAHLLLCSLGTGDKVAVQDMLSSLEQFVKEGQGTMHDIHQRVGYKLCQALVAYKEGDFAQAVDLVYPIRYQIISIGGSHAQRDVFHLFLIMSAIQSSDPKHHQLARTLLEERKLCKENSPQTDRMLVRVKAL